MKIKHILTLIAVMVSLNVLGQNTYNLNYPDIKIGNKPDGGKIVLNGSNLQFPRIGLGSSTDSVLTIVGGVIRKVPRSSITSPTPSLDQVLNVGFTSELPISVGAISAGSGSITSAPTQPTNIARKLDLDTKANLAGGNNFSGTQVITGQFIGYNGSNMIINNPLGFDVRDSNFSDTYFSRLSPTSLRFIGDTPEIGLSLSMPVFTNDREQNFQDASGTIALTSDITEAVANETLQSVTNRGNSTTTGASFMGDVGIGLNTTPLQTLHVRTNNSLNNARGLLIENSSTGATGFQIGNSIIPTNKKWQVFVKDENNTGNPDNYTFTIGQDNVADYLTVKSVSGNIGVGNQNPTAKLDVNGGVKSSSLIGTGERPVVATADGTLAIGTATSTTTQVPEYLVDKVGSTITATPKPGTGLATFTGTDLMVVLQNAYNALSVPGAPPTGRGGTIQIGRGYFETTNEFTMKGFETFGSGNVDPQSQVRIIGTGGATFINQTAAGKNLFIVKDRASGSIEDMFLSMSNSASLSAIFIKGNDINEIGAHRFIIDNIRINSSSTVAEAFKQQNFFTVNVPLLSIYQTGYTNMSLENISGTTNYGNSHFGTINLISPNNNAYAGLSITSTNNHPMNLNLFDALYIGGQYGQANGRGIYLKGGSYNTFTHVDIEYTANPIVIDGVSGTTETTANSFLKGYLYPSDGGTGISIVESGNGNTFDNFKIEGDNANIQLINDLQRFRPSNSFTNFYFGVSLSPSTKINILSASETPLSYTQNGTEIRYSDRTFRVGANDATGDIYFRDTDQRVNRLALGTTGQVLTVSGGKPTWAASTGGGGGVTSIAGTSNQVIASASTGAVTLSLPQSIHTGAFPRFAGQGIGTAADGVNLLKLAGGSTTGAPLLFTSGALTTGLANGRFEYDGSRWYGTATGVRQTFAYSSDLANYVTTNTTQNSISGNKTFNDNVIAGNLSSTNSINVMSGTSTYVSLGSQGSISDPTKSNGVINLNRANANGTGSTVTSTLSRPDDNNAYTWFLPPSSGTLALQTPVFSTAGTSATLLSSGRYIPQNASLTIYTLPTTSAVGDVIFINGKGAGGWRISQNTGQVIHGATDTSIGSGGYIGSTARYNSIAIVCVTANTEWIIQSSQGSLTIN